jgi:hypothetical protein
MRVIKIYSEGGSQEIDQKYKKLGYSEDRKEQLIELAQDLMIFTENVNKELDKFIDLNNL